MEVFEQRFLRAFIAIAQEGSIRRAAERLSIAPSAISRKLADAEIRCGVRLIERHAQGARLTEAGRILLDYASHQADEQAAMLERLGRYRGEAERALRLGIGEGFAADLMQNGLPALLDARPGQRYAIRMVGTDDLLAMAGSGEVDLAIAYHPILTPEVRSLAIGHQPLCAVVPPGHPLAERREVSLAEVLAEPLAILNAGHAIRQLVGRAASDLGLALTPLVETDSIAMLLRFVGAGLGVSFLPRFSVALQQARGELAVLEIDEPLLHEASVHLIIRARRRLPPSVAASAELLAKHMAAFRG